MPPCKLHLWDTAGEEQYRSQQYGYFRDADGGGARVGRRGVCVCVCVCVCLCVCVCVCDCILWLLVYA